MASINGVRVGLHIVIWLFSAVLLGLTATRLHYTIFLPPGDPLNAQQWPHIHIIHRSYDYGRFSLFAFELIGLLILFTLFLVGAAISSTLWGNLFWCHVYWQCRLLTVLIAFAWICWALVFITIVVSVLFAVSNSLGWGRPLHGRYDARDSYYHHEPKCRRCGIF
ncbi:hypothetical protein C8Q78DRAFT_1111573 [Trametes maxima]|nr:hypothetical protein C8Q78DRAFT_1111573 [Trametes maxima]